MSIIKKTLAVLCVLSFCISVHAGTDTNRTKTLKGQNAQKAAAKEKTNSYQATFVELGSVNCIPCKMMQPVMEAVEKEYGNKVKVVFYDVWTKEGRPYGSTYKIRAIPTQVFLDKDGKEFFRHEGFFPKEDIDKILHKQGIHK